MKYLRLATYEITKGTVQELADISKTGMLPKFQGQPGFISFGVADLGDKECLSISMWETREQAQAATPVAATWVKENIADRVSLKSESVGDLAFLVQDVPATV